MSIKHYTKLYKYTHTRYTFPTFSYKLDLKIDMQHFEVENNHAKTILFITYMFFLKLALLQFEVRK